MSRKDFFQGSTISPENLAKLQKYREEVAGLEQVPIICPRCKKVADRVFVDATGHKSIRCYYCKLEFVSALPQFRTVKRRNHRGPNFW